eukprot:scaffold2893_cov254-Pinguiococcus_pyrenoidosus.AAC.33
MNHKARSYLCCRFVVAVGELDGVDLNLCKSATRRRMNCSQELHGKPFQEAAGPSSWEPSLHRP